MSAESNCKSALIHNKVIDDYLEEEIRMGSIAGPFAGPSRASSGPWNDLSGRALGGLGAQPLRKFFATTPFSLVENEGHAPFMTNYSTKLLEQSV